EPGTQLTMRTFHIGGTATRVSERSTLEARNNGVVKFVDMKFVEGRGGTSIAMNRAGLIAIVDEKNREKERYHVVYGARLRVQDGDVLAKIPRETTKTKDITGGLPRVVELFETRKPKDPAVISEIDGSVRYGDIAKGMRKVYVESEDGKTSKEYSIPRGVHIN